MSDDSTAIRYLQLNNKVLSPTMNITVQGIQIIAREIFLDKSDSIRRIAISAVTCISEYSMYVFIYTTNCFYHIKHPCCISNLHVIFCNRSFSVIE